MANRKDPRGRTLKSGEVYRKDGRYVYTYTNPLGQRKYIYANDLVSLRRKEQELLKAQLDGLDVYTAGNASINFVFDRYISLKQHLKDSTRSGYIYTYNHFVRKDFGKKKIADIKYSDVVQYYLYLLKDKNIALGTLDSIHCLLHPTFELAVRDDIIRKNPATGAMKEVNRKSGKNRGIRHALTIEQQRAFMNYIANSPVYYHWWPLFTFLLGTGCRIGDDDDKIRLNQRKPSKYKGLSRFGPEKNLQRINKFMKERPTFYKKLIQMKENFRFYLRCFYCITKVVILQFNSEKQDRISS